CHRRRGADRIGLCKRMTKGTQIVDAMLTKLNGPGAPVTAERDRGLELPPGAAGSIVIRRFKELGERFGPQGPLLKRILIVAAECRASGSAAESADEALDPLLEWVTATLGGERLGGLAHEVVEAEIKFEQVQGDVRYAKATVYLTA